MIYLIVKLSSLSKEKDLGIIFINDFTYNINVIFNKAICVFGFLSRIIIGIFEIHMLTFFIFFPIDNRSLKLQYGSIIFNPHQNNLKLKLE